MTSRVRIALRVEFRKMLVFLAALYCGNPLPLEWSGMHPAVLARPRLTFYSVQEDWASGLCRAYALSAARQVRVRVMNLFCF